MNLTTAIAATPLGFIWLAGVAAICHATACQMREVRR